LLGGARIAHEVIFELRRELLAKGRDEAQQAGLLGESARIVTTELPRLTTDVRQLAARWEEQTLLDPEAADLTLGALAAELARVESQVRPLLQRQRQIAAALRAELGS
jgi:hypothetical protein